MLDYVAIAILIAIILLVVFQLVAVWGIPFTRLRSRATIHTKTRSALRRGAAFLRWARSGLSC